MTPGFPDLLTWLFGWKAVPTVPGPCGVAAGQIHVAGADRTPGGDFRRPAGQIDVA